MRPGQPIPEFDVVDEQGNAVSHHDCLGTYSVFFFYPKDLSLGCTREACSFRDAYSDLKAMGAKVFGVSRDAAETHIEFKQRNKLPFALLCDEGEVLHNRFGVTTQLFGLIRERKTFVFDPTGRLIDSYNSVSNMNGHAEFAVQCVQKDRARSANP